MIKKVKEGYRVVSEKGRNMGTYKTLAEAKKRLQQIEFFKRKEKMIRAKPGEKGTGDYYRIIVKPKKALRRT